MNFENNNTTTENNLASFASMSFLLNSMNMNSEHTIFQNKHRTMLYFSELSFAYASNRLKLDQQIFQNDQLTRCKCI